jgi:hypothetical protein
VLRGRVQVRRRCSDLRSGSEDSHPAAAVRSTSAGRQRGTGTRCFRSVFFLLCFPAACLVRLLTNEIALVCLLTNEMLVLHFAISILLLLLTFFFPLDFIFSLRSLHLQFSFTVFSSNFLLTPILFFCLQLPDGAAFKIKIDTGNFIYSKMSLPNILPIHTSFTGTFWYPQKGDAGPERGTACSCGTPASALWVPG